MHACVHACMQACITATGGITRERGINRRLERGILLGSIEQRIFNSRAYFPRLVLIVASGNLPWMDCSDLNFELDIG